MSGGTSTGLAPREIHTIRGVRMYFEASSSLMDGPWFFACLSPDYLPHDGDFAAVFGIGFRTTASGPDRLSAIRRLIQHLRKFTAQVREMHADGWPGHRGRKIMDVGDLGSGWFNVHSTVARYILVQNFRHGPEWYKRPDDLINHPTLLPPSDE